MNSNPMNMLFKNNAEIKRRIFHKSIHKAMIITVDIHQKIKHSVLQFNQKMHINCKLQIIMATICWPTTV